MCLIKSCHIHAQRQRLAGPRRTATINKRPLSAICPNVGVEATRAAGEGRSWGVQEGKEGWVCGVQRTLTAPNGCITSAPTSRHLGSSSYKYVELAGLADEAYSHTLTKQAKTNLAWQRQGREGIKPNMFAESQYE